MPSSSTYPHTQTQPAPAITVSPPATEGTPAPPPSTIHEPSPGSASGSESVSPIDLLSDSEISVLDLGPSLEARSAEPPLEGHTPRGKGKETEKRKENESEADNGNGIVLTTQGLNDTTTKFSLLAPKTPDPTSSVAAPDSTGSGILRVHDVNTQASISDPVLRKQEGISSPPDGSGSPTPTPSSPHADPSSAATAAGAGAGASGETTPTNRRPKGGAGSTRGRVLASFSRTISSPLLSPLRTSNSTARESSASGSNSGSGSGSGSGNGGWLGRGRTDEHGGRPGVSRARTSFRGLRGHITGGKG